MTTFWDGKQKDQVDKLNLEVPTMGEVTDKNRPYLELWREFSNSYYDVYNNGCCNFPTGKDKGLRKAERRFNYPRILTTQLREFNPRSLKQLEDLADKVFEMAVAEQKCFS